MRLRYLMPLVLLATPTTPLPAAGGELLQPSAGDRGLILVAEPGRATVELPGGRRMQVRLGSQEVLSDFAETSVGWAAAGTKIRNASTDLIVVEQSAAGLRRLPEPGALTAPLRIQPRLLTAGDGVGGLAWLEGRDSGSLSVRSASWDGSEWQAVEVVSPPLAGSQTGLSATLLDDGSWLLVWAAFDGHDDEIYWSLRKNQSWTPPKALAPNNSWPDVTPTVVATSAGALAAWSRNDGSDYRLTLSRFDGSGWQPPQTIGGKGSIAPRLTTLGRQTFLLFNAAAAGAWTVLELQPSGQISRQASVAGPGDERPVLTWSSSHQVGLRSHSVRETTAQWGVSR